MCIVTQELLHPDIMYVVYCVSQLNVDDPHIP